MSNLVKRILSAIILAPIFIYIIMQGGTAVTLLVAFMFAVMLYEWSMITSKANQKILWLLFGFIYLGFGMLTFLALTNIRVNFSGLSNFPIFLFVLMGLVWVNDIFAYIFGKNIGGPKLWPSVSPNKTWAGFIGGITACVGVFFIINYFLTDFSANTMSDSNFLYALLVHIIVPIVATAGDLFESSIKRKFGVKDSGNIIPGHGGLLDRFDGVLSVMIVTGLLLMIAFAFKAGEISAINSGAVPL